MQWWVRQNLSSLRRRHMASFSTSRMNLASHSRNWITSGSTMDGTDHPPVPMRRASMTSPPSTTVISPTMAPLLDANRCSSSRRLSSVTSRSSMIGSDSAWSSKVFSRVPAIVCLVM
jgi:hypothetical protein